MIKDLNNFFLKGGLVFIFLCFIFNKDINAQEIYSVKGMVISGEDDSPIIGATVSVLDEPLGSITDENGNYSIKSEMNLHGRKLRFTSVGYNEKIIEINKTKIDISLDQDLTNLNELVVTGYSTQKKANLTGAIDIVNVQELKEQPQGDVTKLLQGKAPGITVISTGQPGESPQIRIRGINTFGNNTPLYIVDGIATQDISNLNPSDIESIQVLKDAGSASIYGSRASNGVIIITTKLSESSGVQVNYDGYMGVQIPKRGNVFNVLTPIERGNLKWMALKNSGETNITDELYGNGSEPRIPDYLNPVGAMEGDPNVNPSLYTINPVFSPSEFSSLNQITKTNKAGTIWYDEIFHSTPTTNHNISVSGSSSKAKYFLSLNYYFNKGILKETFLRRYTVRANSSFNVGKNIMIGENLTYSIRKDRLLTGNSDQSNSLRNVATTPTIIPVYDIMGNYGGARGTYLFGDNPVAFQDRTKNNNNWSTRLLGSVFGQINFLKLFNFRTTFGGDIRNVRQRSFIYPAYEGYLPPVHSNYTEVSNLNYSWMWTNTLNFHKEFGKNDIDFLLGSETISQKAEFFSGSRQDYFSFDPNFLTLSAGTGTQTVNSSRDIESLFSIFGQLNYNYSEKYIASLTIRRDGSSKFINKQDGWFPSLGLGWRISNESFMGNISWLNDLKIRGSWGIMGNQLNVNPYNGYSTFESNKALSYYDIAGTNSTTVPGFQIGQIGAPETTWEKDINTNIGFDVALLKGVIQITADYYWKNIKDLLFNPALIATQGAGTPPFINIAKVKNEGVDLSLTSHINVSRDLSFDGSLSFTTYRNRIRKVTDLTDHFWSGSARRFGTQFQRNQVGQSIGAFYGYKIIGFWNSQEEIDEANNTASHLTGDPETEYQEDIGMGRFRYADINGDGIINPEDRTFIGNPNPNFSYGFNLGVNFHQFDLSMFFYGVQGNQIWNNLKWWLDFFPSFATAKSKTALYDSWTPEHKNAKVAIQENAGFTSTNGVPNSYYIENGSYFRAKNIVIGYTFSENILKAIGISDFRIYLQTENLFTLTKYSGVDPEISGTAVDFGVDGGGGIYPHAKQFIFGINLNF